MFQGTARLERVAGPKKAASPRRPDALYRGKRRGRLDPRVPPDPYAKLDPFR